jgi:hypothetical protein
MPSNTGDGVTTSVPDRKFKILSIDGGGIRGIISSAILVSLESTLRSLSGKPDLKIRGWFDLKKRFMNFSSTRKFGFMNFFPS